MTIKMMKTMMTMATKLIKRMMIMTIKIMIITTIKMLIVIMNERVPRFSTAAAGTPRRSLSEHRCGLRKEKFFLVLAF